MGNKIDHDEVMEKKSKDSRKKFEIQMLGTGMFRDFEKFIEEKKLRKVKEEENET
jgi:hypothetical protein